MNHLPQPPRNNEWPMHPTHQNFRTRFQRKCDYLLGFHDERRYRLDDNFLQKKWPKIGFNIENNVYESH